MEKLCGGSRKGFIVKKIELDALTLALDRVQKFNENIEDKTSIFRIEELRNLFSEVNEIWSVIALHPCINYIGIANEIIESKFFKNANHILSGARKTLEITDIQKNIIKIVIDKMRDFNSDVDDLSKINLIDMCDVFKHINKMWQLYIAKPVLFKYIIKHMSTVPEYYLDRCCDSEKDDDK